MSKPRKQHNQGQHKGHNQHHKRERPWAAATTAGMAVELTAHGLWIDIHDTSGDRDVYLSARELRALAGVGISERMRALTGLVIVYQEAQEAQEAREAAEPAEAEAEAEAGVPLGQGQGGRPESGG